MITVGQKVYVVSRSRGNGIREDVVSKVGKKYFELEGLYRSRFYIETLIEDGKQYSPNYRVYLDKQEILDDQEQRDLSSEISKHFSLYSKTNFPLLILRKIKAVIDEHSSTSVQVSDTTISSSDNKLTTK